MQLDKPKSASMRDGERMITKVKFDILWYFYGNFPLLVHMWSRDFH